MQSIVESRRGIDVILDSRKVVLVRFAFWAFVVARSIMSCIHISLISVLSGTEYSMR